MFDSLYNLHKKNGDKYPLEDFTTEGFASVLKLNPDIGYAFCRDFLKLPEDEYLIETQYYQSLNTEDPNCIIDMVLLGRNHVCYIENKVESSEGYEQLARYRKALMQHYSEKIKFLCYCTKYADLKSEEENQKHCVSKEINVIFFKQFRWYEIAKFLTSFKNKPIVQSYLEFLKTYKMSQDNTLKSENLLAMENLKKTLEIAEFHIDNSKDNFIQLFGSSSFNKNFNWDQINKQNRFCYRVESVLPSPSGQYSEILYSIDFANLKMISQIYLSKKHEIFKTFCELQLVKDLTKVHLDTGTAIQLTEDLGKYLNDSNADKGIQEWFAESFNKIRYFIAQNSQLNWNIKSNA